MSLFRTLVIVSPWSAVLLLSCFHLSSSTEKLVTFFSLKVTSDYRLRDLIALCRTTVNALIGVFEEEVYRQKEKVLD